MESGVPEKYATVAEFLGQGLEGPAYALADDRVLKLTEAEDPDLYLRRLRHAADTNPPWLVRIYAAGRLKGGRLKKGVWCVIERAYEVSAEMAETFAKVDEEAFDRTFRPVNEPGAREYRTLAFHAKKGGHSDVSGGNVMMRKDGSLVMIDPTSVRVPKRSE
jgi:hypothetical protein